MRQDFRLPHDYLDREAAAVAEDENTAVEVGVALGTMHPSWRRSRPEVPARSLSAWRPAVSLLGYFRETSDGVILRPERSRA